MKKNNIKKEKLLLIGGEGYIGLVIKKILNKKGYDVYTYDNLIYSKEQKSKSKKFLYGDIRDSNNLYKILKNFNKIIILAGLVGDPITKNYPKLSKHVNDHAIVKLIKMSANLKIKKLIFISTCSNYGMISSNQIADENFKLKPLSLYAKSKVKIEKTLINLKSTNLNYTILRFATAFGISARMRFDLTINQFVRDIFYKKKLTIYDADTWRPYCHVFDFANIIYEVLQQPKKTNREIFNVGRDDNNYSKEMIIQKLRRYFPNLKIIYGKNDVDRRNYRVNFNKIQKILKVKPRYSIDFGIKQIIRYLEKKPVNFYNKSIKYGNYKILEEKIKYDQSS